MEGAPSVILHGRKQKTADECGEVTMEAEPCRAVTPQIEDPYFQALVEAHQALDRAISVGKERLKVVDQAYYTGQETGQDPRLAEVRAHCLTSMSQVDALTTDLARKIHKVPIYKLSTEVMYLVFGYLGMCEVFACRDTCQKWRDILGSVSAHKYIWAKAPVCLDKLPRETYVMLEKIREYHLKPSFMVLWLYNSHSTLWKSLSTLRQIALEELREFEYASANTELWYRIAGCPQLKVLDWSHHGKSDTPINFALGGRPLCQLDKFRLSSSSKGGIKIDKHFVQMLSKIKRLETHNALGLGHLKAILNTAQDFLEEVIISSLSPCDDWVGDKPNDTGSNYQFNKLRIVRVESESAGVLCSTAPNATRVEFTYGSIIDWTLLDSCRSKLRTLRIELKGRETVGRYAQELFDMPQLEILSLDYKREDNSGFTAKGTGLVSYQDYSAAAFWAAIKDTDIGKIQDSLPKLKTLSIIHDPMLDADLFLKYIEMRSLLGQPELREVDLYLADHCSNDTAGLEALCARTPGFTVKGFDDWKINYTHRHGSPQEWYRKSRLLYRKIYWDELEVSRSTLRYLHIQTYCIEVDKGLQNELFNMPQLEQLLLEFTVGEARRRSVTALWEAYTTGVTGKPGVLMQDILPNLTKLVVINDATLKEHIIVKMIERREILGLSAIKEMHIRLASGCSDEYTKLESLRAMNHKLAFKRFDQWGRKAGVASDPEEEVVKEARD